MNSAFNNPTDATTIEPTNDGNTGEWVDLTFDYRYDINTAYPHQIRRKKGLMIVTEYTHKKDGYVRCSVGGRTHMKHRLIAQQFIPNPDGLKCVDHINHIRSDNRIENLRWVSYSGNTRNRSCYRDFIYEYVDEIPPESLVVDRYSEWEFEDLYFHDDVFYTWNGIKYRKLRINEAKSGHCSVSTKDAYNITRAISYVKFKRERDLI